MLLSDFSYDLPRELIAQNPVEPRDAARLFVYDRESGTVRHAHVRDLPDLLPEPTLLVVNDSKVRQARLFGKVGDKEIEVLLLEPKDEGAYTCMVRGRNLKPGSTVTFYESPTYAAPLSVTATLSDREDHPGMQTWSIRFATDSETVEAMCRQYGQMPLPPYITESTAKPERYQPVFAKQLGSAAAPTAGLHFTPGLIERLRAGGHLWEEVTLHVGLGTFLPLREEVIVKNVLHEERTYVTPETAISVRTAKQTGKPVLSVGTTSTRTLESHTDDSGTVQSGWQDTKLFIYPGYQFKTVSHLLTNFHLPKSSLLTLVAAFLGNDRHGNLTMPEPEMAKLLLDLYTKAVHERYRFYSFGDAMLIL